MDQLYYAPVTNCTICDRRVLYMVRAVGLPPNRENHPRCHAHAYTAFFKTKIIVLIDNELPLAQIHLAVQFLLPRLLSNPYFHKNGEFFR